MRVGVGADAGAGAWSVAGTGVIEGVVFMLIGVGEDNKSDSGTWLARHNPPRHTASPNNQITLGQYDDSCVMSFSEPQLPRLAVACRREAAASLFRFLEVCTDKRKRL
jgi:hypothetical protein